MRFKVTASRIEIDPLDARVEDVVLAVVDVLVPKFTPKLYFYGKPTEGYATLAAAADNRRDFVILDPKTHVNAVAKRVRVVHQDDRLFVVPQLHGKLLEKQWKQVCRSIQDAIET